jgi:hypothetical protein
MAREVSPQENNEASYHSSRHTPGRSSSPFNTNSIREMKTPDIMAEPSLANLRSSAVPSKRGREIVSGMPQPKVM